MSPSTTPSYPQPALDLTDVLIQRMTVSRQPLALLDRSGQTLFVNALMRARMTPAWLNPEQIRKMLDSESPLPVAASSSNRTGLQLIPFHLDDVIVVALFEARSDPRLERLRDQLEAAEHDSVTDPMTGAWNRNQFNQLLQREHTRALRYRQPISLLILDIDHFKQINDRFGHQAGDQVLIDLVRMIAGSLRSVDSLFRWGGEEFVVLLPNTGRAGCQKLAERLRQTVADHAFPTVGNLTISLGGAALERDEAASHWFERADQALYAAKRSGRNRIEVAPEGLPWPIHGASENPLLMPWLPRYECGHPLIDAQHYKLFELANLLITSSIDPNTSRAQATERLDALIDHSIQHFTDEEALLEQLEYSELAAHRNSHIALLEHARKLRRRVVKGIAGHSDLLDFLVNRLVRQHLMTADFAFFPLLHTADESNPHAAKLSLDRNASATPGAETPTQTTR